MWLINFFLGLFKINKKCTCKGKQICKTTLIISNSNGSNVVHIKSKCNEIVKITGVNQNLYYVWLDNKVIVAFKPLKGKKVTRGVLVKSVIPHKIVVEFFKVFD